MTNPLVLVADQTKYTTGEPLGRGLWLWCPGCDMAHRPQTVGADGSQPDGPCWDWNGRTDEGFSIEPSLLVYTTVHLCEGEHRPLACPDPEGCGQPGHLILDDGTCAHPTPHTREPAWGNCHSFIRNGQWQFLSDSAHRLAGQTVPMVPLPDWLCSASGER